MTTKTLRSSLTDLFLQEDINFLLTNRIPRRLATRFMGWFSKIEDPTVCAASIALWRLFSDLDLSEARQTSFRSLHDCFTRELKDGARPVDRDSGTVVSPCDAIVGAHGRLAGTELLQIKGFPYSLCDLLGTKDLAERHRDGLYVTLRLTSSMYHRFHSPHDLRVERVTYISGDTWNVNSIALKRVERHGETVQPDAGDQDRGDRHQGHAIAVAQPSLDHRALVLAEQPLDPLQRDRIDVPGVPGNVSDPFDAQIMR